MLQLFAAAVVLLLLSLSCYCSHLSCIAHTSMPQPQQQLEAHICVSSGGMPEGKDPEMDSETARKKDPFFKEVDKRTK